MMPNTDTLNRGRRAWKSQWMRLYSLIIMAFDVFAIVNLGNLFFGNTYYAEWIVKVIDADLNRFKRIALDCLFLFLLFLLRLFFKKIFYTANDDGIENEVSMLEQIDNGNGESIPDQTMENEKDKNELKKE